MSKCRTTPKCEICKIYYADYALQYIGDNIPQFYILGWHIRGFDLTKVCADCMMTIKSDYMIADHKITNLKGHKI